MPPVRSWSALPIIITTSINWGKRSFGHVHRSPPRAAPGPSLDPSQPPGLARPERVSSNAGHDHRTHPARRLQRLRRQLLHRRIAPYRHRRRPAAPLPHPRRPLRRGQIHARPHAHHVDRVRAPATRSLVQRPDPRWLLRPLCQLHPHRLRRGFGSPSRRRRRRPR